MADAPRVTSTQHLDNATLPSFAADDDALRSAIRRGRANASFSADRLD